MKSTAFLRNSGIIVLAMAGVAIFGFAQKATKSGSVTASTNAAAGRETFQKFCASCHGTYAKGDGPAARALNPPPSDLTTLALRHEGRYPSGYVGAILMFGRNFAPHGADDMPVWGSRFAGLDPTHDPTGQHHVDDVVAYLASLQAK